MKIIKRTFEAKNYTGKKRAGLNDAVETSEYMPSQKWVVRYGDFYRTFRTKTEAEKFAKEHK